MVPRKHEPAPCWLKAARRRRRNFASKNTDKPRRLRAVDEVLTDRIRSTRPPPQSASHTLHHPFLPGLSALSINDFDLVKKLGEGTSACVYLARHSATDFFCALKVIDKATWSDEPGRSSILREIQVHESLKNKYIVELLSWFQDEGTLYLVLEYAPGGDLQTHLQKQRNGRFREAQAAQYVFQIAKSLRHMHRKSLIHRDVKLENVLVCSHNKTRLADFGFSQLCRSGFSSRKCGTTEYLSPEMATAYLKPGDWAEFYVGATDQWSLGVLMYGLLTGEFPFDAGERQATLKKIARSKGKDIEFPSHVSKYAEDLIRKLLKRQPKLRMDFDEVLMHPWIRWHTNKPMPGFKRLFNRTMMRAA